MVVFSFLQMTLDYQRQHINFILKMFREITQEKQWKDFPYEGASKQTLIDQQESVLYLPVYVKIKINKIEQLNLDSDLMQVNLTIYVTIDYQDIQNDKEDLQRQKSNLRRIRQSKNQGKGFMSVIYVQQENDQGKIANQPYFLSQLIIKRFREEGVTILRDGNELINLNPQGDNIEFNDNEEELSFNFEVTNTYSMNVKTNNFWSPFELMFLYSSLELCEFNVHKNSDWVVRFNVMSCSDMKYVIRTDGNVFQQNYEVAENMLYVTADNFKITGQIVQEDWDYYYNNLDDKERRKKPVSLKCKNEKKDIKKRKANPMTSNFGTANVCIGVYRKPIDTVSTIFFPIWSLAATNIGVFLMANSIDNRIQAIATVVLGYVAFISTMRSNMPSSGSDLLFIEYLIYAQIFSCSLSIIQTVIINKSYKQIPGQPETHYQFTPFNIFFIGAVLMLLISIICILVLFLIHYLTWKKKYTGKNLFQAQDTVDIQNDENEFNSFDLYSWSNKRCDKLFKQKIKTKQVRTVVSIQNLKIQDQEARRQPNHCSKFYSFLKYDYHNGSPILKISYRNLPVAEFQAWKADITYLNQLKDNKKLSIDNLLLPKKLNGVVSYNEKGNLSVELIFDDDPYTYYDFDIENLQMLDYWQLLLILVKQAKQFHDNGLGKLGNIKPEALFFYQQSIKIMNKYSWPGSQNTTYRMAYRAPQQIENRFSNPEYSQAFSIGLTMLDLIIQKRYSQQFYGENGKIFYANKLEKSLDKIRSENRKLATQKIRESEKQRMDYLIADQKLTGIILGLCDPNPRTRYSCTQVLHMLTPFQDQIESYIQLDTQQMILIEKGNRGTSIFD